MVLYQINRPGKSGHLDNRLRTGPKVSIIHMFHCRAYEAFLLLQTQGEVSDFGHNCTQSVKWYCSKYSSYNKRANI